ncbi:MAG: SGNH/GDSL hydrolase family protein [Rhodobacteraceae bacterium]|nr:SGNH/GDSL hydrolase family protein [Paracoccaceae bacterium]
MPERNRDRIVQLDLRHNGTLHIIAFGSSLTARALWPAQLQVALQDCGFTEVRVETLARAGAGSDRGLPLVRQAIFEGVDAAILEFAINDADLIDGLSRNQSRENHDAMIAALHGAAPRVAPILMATNPVSGLQRLKRPRLAAYYRDLASLAEARDVGFFDGTWRWTAVRGRVAKDGLHPAPEMEAELYVGPLARLIAAGAGRDCPGNPAG